MLRPLAKRGSLFHRPRVERDGGNGAEWRRGWSGGQTPLGSEIMAHANLLWLGGQGKPHDSTKAGKILDFQFCRMLCAREVGQQNWCKG